LISRTDIITAKGKNHCQHQQINFVKYFFHFFDAIF
jgi:hypothetical protein